MTSAPKARNVRIFISDILSGKVKMHLYPLTTAAIASPTPVFPPVLSITTPPGLSSPRLSASSISHHPMRSLIEPTGFVNSSFA